MIEKNTNIMVLRGPNYKNNSFTVEHKEKFKEKNEVWLVKMGRKVSEKSINQCMDNGGFVILKGPKKDKNNVLIGRVDKIYFGDYRKSYNVPDYYEEMHDDGYLLYGTWFHFLEMYDLDAKTFPGLVSLKNKTPLMELIENTRTVMFFVNTTNNLIVNGDVVIMEDNYE